MFKFLKKIVNLSWYNTGSDAIALSVFYMKLKLLLVSVSNLKAQLYITVSVTNIKKKIGKVTKVFKTCTFEFMKFFILSCIFK